MDRALRENALSLVCVGARSPLGLLTLEVIYLKVLFSTNRAACLLAGVAACVAVVVPNGLVFINYPSLSSTFLGCSAYLRYSGGISEEYSRNVEEGVENLFCSTSWSCFAHGPMESSEGARVMLCKMSGKMRSQGGVIHLQGVLMQ